MTVAVAVLVAGVAATPVGPALASRVSSAFCRVLDGLGCGADVDLRSPYTRATSGEYVALGDSFSSGEGAGDYAPDSDRDENSTGDRVAKWLDDHLVPGDHTTAHPTNFCHRSGSSYGATVAAGNPFAGGSQAHACSGATVDDFYEPDGANADEPPQLDAVTRDTTLVTFSIGGNDMHFADVLADCVWDGATCEDKNEADFQRNLRELRPRLVQLYRDTAARAAPGARVIVVGYPPLFPQHPSDSYRNLLFADDQVWMNEKAAQLDAVLRSAAAEAGVEFVDPTAAFAGHGLGGPDPWFNAISLGGPGWAPVDPGSFHPTAAGQAALARLVQQQLEHPAA